jgi:hypothetical protein
MTTFWLDKQLATMSGVLTDNGNPVLTIEFAGRRERIYCPDPSEYKATAEVVHKAHQLGATIIAYSETWGEGTYEAKQYAKQLKVSLMPYKSLFAYISRYGVR